MRNRERGRMTMTEKGKKKNRVMIRRTLSLVLLNNANATSMPPPQFRSKIYFYHDYFLLQCATLHHVSP